jgi:hypothetical protein
VSRYIFIRRLRGPAFLLLIGVNALLAQANILGWHQSWPLYLILFGVLMLAERAALAAEGYPPPPIPPYSGMNPYGPAQPPASPSPQTAETAIVPARPHDFTIDTHGDRQ